MSAVAATGSPAGLSCSRAGSAATDARARRQWRRARRGSAPTHRRRLPACGCPRRSRCQDCERPRGLLARRPRRHRHRHAQRAARGQAVAALEAGLAVFCQEAARTHRPPRPSMSSAAARRADRLLGVDLSYRHTAASAALRERIAAIGQVHAVELVFHNAYGPDKPCFAIRPGRRRLRHRPRHPPRRPAAVDARLPARRARRGRQRWLGGRPADDGDAEDFCLAMLSSTAARSHGSRARGSPKRGATPSSRRRFAGRDGALLSMRNVDGSFYDFRGELRKGTRRPPIAAPPDAWGGARGPWSGAATRGRRRYDARRRGAARRRAVAVDRTTTGEAAVSTDASAGCGPTRQSCAPGWRPRASRSCSRRWGDPPPGAGHCLPALSSGVAGRALDDVRESGEWLRELGQDGASSSCNLNGYAHGARCRGVCRWSSSGTRACCPGTRRFRGAAAGASWRANRREVRAGLCGADIVVAPSSAMRSALRRLYDFDRDCRVISNGVSPQPTPAPQAATRARRRPSVGRGEGLTRSTQRQRGSAGPSPSPAMPAR